MTDYCVCSLLCDVLTVVLVNCDFVLCFQWISVSDQASKVQRCRRAADLERQHGHFVDDPLLNGQPVQLPE